MNIPHFRFIQSEQDAREYEDMVSSLWESEIDRDIQHKIKTKDQDEQTKSQQKNSRPKKSPVG